MENSERRVLDPVERVSEVMFGLIMVLSFTGSMSVATAGRDDVREMLIGAIGCNLAWGVVDAVMFVLTSVVARGRGLLLLRDVQTAGTPERAQEAIAAALPAPLASSMRPSDYAALRERLMAVPVPARPRRHGRDLRGAVEVFLLVFLSTFPVVLPFLVFSELRPALRVSNAIAVIMLMLGGRIARPVQRRAVRGCSRLTLAGIGVVLVALTIALGG